MVIGATLKVPEVVLEPDHAPEAVHEVVLVEDHVNVLLLPEMIELGLADIETVGDGTTIEEEELALLVELLLLVLLELLVELLLTLLVVALLDELLAELALLTELVLLLELLLAVAAATVVLSAALSPSPPHAARTRAVSRVRLREMWVTLNMA